MLDVENTKKLQCLKINTPKIIKIIDRKMVNNGTKCKFK